MKNLHFKDQSPPSPALLYSMIGLVDFVSQFDVWMRMTFKTFRSDHDYHEQSLNVI